MKLSILFTLMLVMLLTGVDVPAAEVVETGTNDMKITYERCEFEAHLAYEFNDCAVKTVAIVTQTDYDEVRSLFRELGRKDRQPTGADLTVSAFNRLGYRVKLPWTKIPITPETVGVYGSMEFGPVGKRKSFTFRSIVGVVNPHKRYAVMTDRHIAPIVNGEVEDWSKGRLFRVKALWEIEKLER